WAVLIGVDGDSSTHGCVTSALLMKRYLIEELYVPKSNIQCLLSPSKWDHLSDTALRPTCKNIIGTICGLIHNADILKDDIIIIYFAGNSLSVPCRGQYEHDGTPKEYKSRIECLIPIDAKDPSSGIDPSLLISDREISSILTELCRKKGHRITFIVD
ncbi:hypothetical protein EDD18DRAFT_1057813, partial [Armillaria luteobubalina]